MQISGAKIEGELNLESATVSVPLIFDGCAFTAPLMLQNSKLRTLQLKRSHVLGIRADEIQVESSVSLCDGFKATGEVNLSGATIGGRLNCSGGKFSNEGQIALNADAVTIAASVYLRDGFEAAGQVNLIRATIGGRLDCSRGKFSNVGQTAINADAATIAADVFLHNGFEAVGVVNLRGATIGGQLVCIGGKFSNEGQTAINADAATIAADVFLRDGFEAVGQVNLVRATIGGTLFCQGGHFLNKEGDAINAEGATIGGSVFLGGKLNAFLFRAEGKVTFLNSTIDDRFELGLVEDSDSESMTLDLRFAKTNIFSFSDRNAEKIWIEQMKKGQLYLNGFAYSTINVSDNAIKNKLLLKWLRLQTKEGSDPQSDNGFALQPYEQLAAVLKANGHQEAATEVLIAKEDDRRRYGGLTGLGKAWNCFLGLTIAHGYRPQRALLYSLIIMAIGWVLFDLGYKNKLIAETNDTHKPYAVFDSLIYSIDVFTPIIDFHQESTWIPDPNQDSKFHLLFFKTGAMLRGYFWFQIVAGWVLTSLWVAGFTGLVRSQK